jgi:hypothetical protein
MTQFIMFLLPWELIVLNDRTEAMTYLESRRHFTKMMTQFVWNKQQQQDQ